MLEKVLITGGYGMVGNAIQQIHSNYPKYEFIYISSSKYDLSSFESSKMMFKKYKPDYVIHLAACVGGLFKNMNNKVDMLEKNLMINYNIVKCSHDYKVKKLISCLSTCIFPDKTTYPINESMLHSGPPHTSNDAYAYAKRMLEIHSNAYVQQYSDNFICIIPTNIYGEFDNFNLEDAHVIPALIHKCWLAKQSNTKFIVAGSGLPLRQFIYSKDLAFLIMFILENINQKDLTHNDYSMSSSIILSPPEKNEISIGYIAKLIAEEFNYIEHIEFNTNLSDGQYKKTACNNKINELINFSFTDTHIGIKNVVKWFCNNYPNIRK